MERRQHCLRPGLTVTRLIAACWAGGKCLAVQKLHTRDVGAGRRVLLVQARQYAVELIERIVVDTQLAAAAVELHLDP